MADTSSPQARARRFARAIRVLDLIWIGCFSFAGAYFLADLVIRIAS